MSKPWYKKDANLLRELEHQIGDEFPELKKVEEGLLIKFVGVFPLFEEGRVYDRYHIEVELSSKSPTALPIIREVGGRIPLLSDRHINPTDGTACIVLPDAYWFQNPLGMNLIDFLKGPVRKFFASQSLIDLGESNPWSDGEWRHGEYGIKDFYSGILNTGDLEVIYQYLRVLKAKAIKGHWPCPCGSGKKIKECHWTFIEELRLKIPAKIAADSEARIRKIIFHGR